MMMFVFSSFCDVVNFALRPRASLGTTAQLPHIGAVVMNKYYHQISSYERIISTRYPSLRDRYGDGILKFRGFEILKF